MESVGQGAGKLLLFGEHAAVYGYPALGMALPWETRVSLAPSGKHEWELPELLPEEGTNLRKLIDFITAHFPAVKKLGGMKVTIESDIPISMGFGSSAALCVAVVKALVILVAGKVLPERMARGLSRPLDLVWKLANRAERIFHGKPSGIDTGLSLMGDIRSFEFAGRGLPRNEALQAHPFYLVVGGVPRESNTRALVGSIAGRMAAGDAVTGEGIRALGSLTEEAITLLRHGRDGVAGELGLLADRAQEQLASLGLSSPGLETILDRGRRAGAAGGKLSGAGGGGAFFLVAESRERALSVAAALQENAPSGTLPVAVVTYDGASVGLLVPPAA